MPLRPPEPPEREEHEENDHPFLRMLDGLFNLIFITACIAATFFYFVRVEFDRPGPLEVSTVLVVPKGEGVTAIVDRLQNEGVIADRRIFMTSILYFMYLKGEGSLKAGEYEFDKHASMRDVLDILVEGKSVQHRVTVPEGWTSQQVVERLMANPELTGKITEVPPEGSLLPDTYSFGSKDTRQEILQRMQVAQTKFMAKVWEERDPDIMVKTPEQAVILASIVEKETARADERPHIASVFNNRLKKRMRLQSDPTIIYGLFGGAGMRDHPITQEELARENPYNTYKIDGLPPTPIGNPGRAAIEAVLKPAKTNDLYFVADGTGGHDFSASLAEHNKKVAKWRKIERQIRERQEAEAAAAAAAAELGALLPEGEVGLMVATGPVPLPVRNPSRVQ
ncbi:MAG: endolytic transglycosylase MltG [Hyphomicrobiales bacterium]